MLKVKTKKGDGISMTSKEVDRWIIKM